MLKMWRPPNWDEIKETALSDRQLNDENYLDNVFEAAADALLVALRETGFHINVGQVVEIEGTKVAATKNQTLVLIPDDIA